MKKYIVSFLLMAFFSVSGSGAIAAAPSTLEDALKLADNIQMNLLDGNTETLVADTTDFTSFTRGYEFKNNQGSSTEEALIAMEIFATDANAGVVTLPTFLEAANTLWYTLLADAAEEIAPVESLKYSARAVKYDVLAADWTHLTRNSSDDLFVAWSKVRTEVPDTALRNFLDGAKHDLEMSLTNEDTALAFRASEKFLERMDELYDVYGKNKILYSGPAAAKRNIIPITIALVVLIGIAFVVLRMRKRS